MLLQQSSRIFSGATERGVIFRNSIKQGTSSNHSFSMLNNGPGRYSNLPSPQQPERDLQPREGDRGEQCDACENFGRVACSAAATRVRSCGHLQLLRLLMALSALRWQSGRASHFRVSESVLRPLL